MQMHDMHVNARFWLVVQPKLTSVDLLQILRSEDSETSSLVLVFLLLSLGAGSEDEVIAYRC